MKGLFLIILVLILINGQCYAQKLNYVTIKYSLEFYDFNFITDYPIKFQEGNKTFLNCNIGLLHSFSFQNKNILATGILYSQKNYYNVYDYKIFDPPSSFKPYMPFNFKHSVAYIEIPFFYGYNFNIYDRLFLKPNIGVLSGFLFINRQYINEMEIYEGRFKIDKMLFSTSLNLSIEYKLNEKLGIGIEPFYRYCFSNPIKEVLKRAPYSYGLSLNIFCYYHRQINLNP